MSSQLVIYFLFLVETGTVRSYRASVYLSTVRISVYHESFRKHTKHYIQVLFIAKMIITEYLSTYPNDETYRKQQTLQANAIPPSVMNRKLHISAFDTELAKPSPQPNAPPLRPTPMVFQIR